MQHGMFIHCSRSDPFTLVQSLTVKLNRLPSQGSKISEKLNETAAKLMMINEADDCSR